MAICSVCNCNTNNDKRRKKSNEINTELKLFRFPKNEVMAKVWEEKCGRRDKINHRTAYICSKHFTPNQYLRNLQHELLKYSPKSCKKLKDDAIPTEYLPSTCPSNSQIADAQPSNTKVLVLLVKPTEGPRINTKHNQAENPVIPNEEPKSIEYQGEAPGPYTSIPKEETTDLKSDLSRLQGQLSYLLSENQVLRDEISKLQVKTVSQHSQLVRITQEKYRLQQECNTTNKIFSHSQKRKMSRGGSRIQWTDDDMSSSYAIFASGPKAYLVLLEKGYPFPAVITLKKWASKLKTQTLNKTNSNTEVSS